MERRVFLGLSAATIGALGSGVPLVQGVNAVLGGALATRGGRIITSDIPLFLHAKTLADRVSPAERPAIYQREYLDRGSMGLRDFIALHKIVDAKTLAEAVNEHPRYYASLSTLPQRLQATRPAFTRVFKGLKQIYPPARIPDLYFVVGHLWSTGTVSDNGMLLGAETTAISSGTPVEEFDARKRNWIHPLSDVPFNVAHETVHIQQDRRDKSTLLERALIEGTAEFIAEKLVPDGPALPMRPWADAHEQQVWSRFKTQMDGTDLSDWIANNDRETPDWPAALGYYVGYRIARGYFERMTDKRLAIRSLFELRDAHAILRASGYGDRFR